jgi:hypothetical protein
VSKEEVRKAKAQMRREKIDMTSAQATYWLRDKLAHMGSVRRNDILKYGGSPDQVLEGRFYFFNYDPKTKGSMPFYDEFPLVFAMHFQPKGFLGINFHYLEPRYRIWFINRLVQYADTPDWDKHMNSMIDAEYSDFVADKRLRFYKPSIKSYLYTRIVSKVVMVPPSDWKTTLFMPLEQFAKMPSQEVWKWSRSQI